MCNFHDRFASRSVMRRMAHQAPHIVIAENERLNALVTNLRNALQRGMELCERGHGHEWAGEARNILEGK
jgi:hypothetical protein